MQSYTGLAAVLISWAAGAYLLRKWRGTRTMSISQHAASASAATKLFAVTLMATGFVLYAWLLTWYSDALQLGWVFRVILTTAFIGQIIAALVPDSGGWRTKVHGAGAYSMALLFVPLSYLALTAQEFSLPTTILGIVGLCYMPFSWFLYFFVKRSRDHYLIFQILYIMSFELIILSTAYIG